MRTSSCGRRHLHERGALRLRLRRPDAAPRMQLQGAEARIQESNIQRSSSTRQCKEPGASSGPNPKRPAAQLKNKVDDTLDKKKL